MIVESYEDVIVLSGALRSNYWETLHTAVSLTLKRHPTGVIIDCSGITEATEEGVETFHDAIDFVAEHDQARIIVAAVRPDVLNVMRMVPEVRSQLPIVATVDEARRSLDLLVDEEDGRKKRREPARAVDRTLLVCLAVDETEPFVLELAIELCRGIPTKICVLLPLLVPRDLPLQAPLPDVETSARRVADASRDRLETMNIPHEVRLERTRDFASLIQEYAEETDAAHVIIGIRHDERHQDDIQKILRNIQDKIKRSLVFVRGPV